MLLFKGKKRICSDHHVCILMGWALFWIAPWVVFSVKKTLGMFLLDVKYATIDSLPLEYIGRKGEGGCVHISTGLWKVYATDLL